MGKGVGCWTLGSHGVFSLLPPTMSLVRKKYSATLSMLIRDGRFIFVARGYVYGVCQHRCSGGPFLPLRMSPIVSSLPLPAAPTGHLGEGSLC